MSIIKRLEQCNSKYDICKTGSHILLAKEFMRRMTLWGKQLDALEDWPYIDVASVLNCDTKIRDEDENLISNLLNKNGYISGLQFIKSFVRQLGWERCSLEIKKNYDHLPEPYEPIVVMRERGGRFSIANGYLEFASGAAIPRKRSSDYDISKSFINIESPIELDKADEEYIELIRSKGGKIACPEK